MTSNVIQASIATLEELISRLDQARLSYPAIHVATAIDALKREAEQDFWVTIVETQ